MATDCQVKNSITLIAGEYVLFPSRVRKQKVTNLSLSTVLNKASAEGGRVTIKFPSENLQ